MPQVAFEKARNFALDFMFEEQAQPGYPLAEKLEAVVKTRLPSVPHYLTPDVLEFFQLEGVLDADGRLTAKGRDLVYAMKRG